MVLVGSTQNSTKGGNCTDFKIAHLMGGEGGGNTHNLFLAPLIPLCNID